MEKTKQIRIYESKKELEECFLLMSASLSFFKDWLNKNYKKENGKPFNVNDAYSYVNVVKKLPAYLGGNEIIVSKGDAYGNAGIYVLKNEANREDVMNFYFNTHLI